MRGSKAGVGIEYPEAVSPGTGGVAEGGLDVGSGVGGRGHAARLVAARRHGIGKSGIGFYWLGSTRSKIILFRLQLRCQQLIFLE